DIDGRIVQLKPVVEVSANHLDAALSCLRSRNRANLNSVDFVRRHPVSEANRYCAGITATIQQRTTDTGRNRIHDAVPARLKIVEKRRHQQGSKHVSPRLSGPCPELDGQLHIVTVVDRVAARSARDRLRPCGGAYPVGCRAGGTNVWRERGMWPF